MPAEGSTQPGQLPAADEGSRGDMREKACIRAKRVGVAAYQRRWEERSSANNPVADGLVL